MVTPATLRFTAHQAGGDPAAQTATISGQGGATLSNLSLGSVRYGGTAAGWLDALALSSASTPATLVVQPATGDLPPGTYRALVTVSAAAPEASSQVDVELTISSYWDDLRAGKPFAGLNAPWDAYGRDFGANAWGDAGLGNQGPGGWRAETRGVNNAVTLLQGWQHSASNRCLGVDVSLTGSPANSAVVFFRFDERAEQPMDATLDLRGRTYAARVFVPPGARGPSSAPCGVMLFAQDSDWRWSQTEWRNVEAAGSWVSLAVTGDQLGAATPGFDPSRVRTIGMKYGVNRAAPAFSFAGRLGIDDVVVTGLPSASFDFESPATRTEAEFVDMATQGEVIRYWLLADGRSGVVFSPDGAVLGLDPRVFRDLDELIRVAKASRVFLILTLVDFLIGAEAEVVDGVQLYGRAALLADPVKRRGLLDNAIRPILARYANEPTLLAVDACNEPEWLLSDVIIPAGKRPPQIRPGGVVSLEAMRAFVAGVAQLRADVGAKQLLTVGSASPRWISLWEDIVDINQVHWWATPGSGQIDDGNSLPAAGNVKPTFIGEFAAADQAAHCQFMASARALGYTAALPWSYRAKDTMARHSVSLQRAGGHCP